MQRIEFTVPDGMSGRTVKGVLTGELSMSSSLISRVKVRENGILVNGERAFTTARLKPGDILSVEISDSLPENAVTPVFFPLQVLFEDEFITVINKPAKMSVHPGPLACDDCTVANALAFNSEDPFVFHPVNRLDRGTTGIMVAAKSAYVHELFRRILHTSDFRREYRAVVLGTPDPAFGVIKLPIGRAPDSAIKRMVSPEGTPSETEYETLSEKDGLAFLRLIPTTGRTHQLRVHMAAIGHPLAGDWLYGTEDKELIERPALHSYFLRMKHPVTDQVLELYAPLPADIERLV